MNSPFAYLLETFGSPIYLNDESTSRKAVIDTPQMSVTSVKQFDDLRIRSPFIIKRGDSVKYNNVPYLIMSDVQTIKTDFYQSLIRPTTNTISIRVQEEEREIIGYTDLMQPIYGDIIQEEVIEDVPCIIKQETFRINAQEIVIAESQIQLILGDNYKSQKVQVNDEYILFDKTYKFTDINLFQQGLRLFTAERVQNN